MNNQIMQDVFFSMENHKEGAWFRFYTDETDKFSSTFLTIDFDLSLTVLEEPIIVSNNMQETSVALINEFTERNRLTPKYIGSFLDHWNSYKKENNKFHGISPLETGTLPIDVDRLLQKIKNESETTNFQSIEQIDLPIGKINKGGIQAPKRNLKETFYHGSANKFDHFSLDFNGKNGSANGFGIYLTANKEMANMYTRSGSSPGYLYKVEAKLNKEVSETERRISKQELSEILDYLHVSHDILNDFNDVSSLGKAAVKEEALDALNENENDIDLINELANLTGDSEEVARVIEKVGGYTHVISVNQTRLKDDVLVVFSPENVNVMSVQDHSKEMDVPVVTDTHSSEDEEKFTEQRAVVHDFWKRVLQRNRAFEVTSISYSDKKFVTTYSYTPSSKSDVAWQLTVFDKNGASVSQYDIIEKIIKETIEGTSTELLVRFPESTTKELYTVKFDYDQEHNHMSLTENNEQFIQNGKDELEAALLEYGNEHYSNELMSRYDLTKTENIQSAIKEVNDRRFEDYEILQKGMLAEALLLKQNELQMEQNIVQQEMAEISELNKKNKQEQAKPDTLPVFTEKQMNYARRVNMYDYMLARGEEFIKVSSKFVSHAYHDSLCANVNTGVVTWYSQNINSFNNGIEFSMSFFNEPFEEATQNILDFYSGQQSIRKEKQQIRQHIPATPFSLSKLTEGGNYAKDFLDEKGMNYLLSRYISKETIQHFQERRLITSDNRSNILFSMSGLTKGELGTVVGADVQGTYPKPVKDRIRFDKVSGEMKLDRKYFKGIALNTQQDHGFLYGTNVQFNQPFHLFVVEGPIESLSYYELFKNQLPDNSWILSTSGLKAETIVKTNEQLKTLLKTENSTIVLAVNNDDPGKNFVRKFYDIYQENPALKETSKLKLQLPTIEDGDFNEVLELKKTGQLASREIKENEYAQAKKLIQKRTKEANELVGVYQ